MAPSSYTTSQEVYFMVCKQRHRELREKVRPPQFMTISVAEVRALLNLSSMWRVYQQSFKVMYHDVEQIKGLGTSQRRQSMLYCHHE